MHVNRRLLPTALLAALALCATASSASARVGIGIAAGDERPTLTTGALSFTSGGVSVVCPVTLTTTLANGTSKVLGQKVGEVRSATVAEGSCRGGTARILGATLPWDIKYRSFTGTLPNITSVALDLVGVAALVSIAGIGCLFRGTAQGTATSERGEVRQLTINGEVEIPLFRSLSIFCPASGSLAGTFTVAPVVNVSLLEGIGSTLSAPREVTLRREDANRAFDITAGAGGGATVVTVTAVPDGALPGFTVSGCGPATLILANSTCRMTITPEERRPTEGAITISYKSNWAQPTSLVVRVRIL